MSIQTKTMKVKSDTSIAETTTTIRDTVTFDVSKMPNGITYKGLKAVLSFADPIQWNKASTYDALTVVWDDALHGSYASKRPVPANIELTNEFYWLRTADLDAQVEQYRQEVRELDGHVKKLEADVAKITSEIATKATFFESLDQLKQSNLPVGAYAHIDYVHEGNTAGSGFYKISNNRAPFSYPMNNGNYASLIYDNYTSVDTFGAYGDGSTDDSTLFQTIINTGIPLNLNNRTYIIDQPVTCNNTVNMNGISRDTDSSKIKFSKTGCIDANQNKVNIKDVCFEGYSETDKTETGFINLHTEINFTNVQARFIKTFLKYAANVWGGFSVFNNCKIVYCDTVVNAPDSIRFNQNVFNSCIFQRYKNLFDLSRCEALYFNACDFELSEDGIILGAGKKPCEFYGVNFTSCYLESQGKLMSSSWACNILFDSCWLYNPEGNYILENAAGNASRTLVTFKNNVLNTKDIIKDSTINVSFENNTVKDEPLNTGYTGQIADSGFSKLINATNENKAVTVSGTSGQDSKIMSIIHVGAANELPASNTIRTDNYTLFAFVRDTKKLMYFNSESWVEINLA